MRVQIEGKHRAVVAVRHGVPQGRRRVARQDEGEVERARRREHAEPHVEGRAPHLRREQPRPRGLAVLEARLVPELGGHGHPACAHLNQLEVNVRRIGEQLAVARRVAPVEARRAAAACIALATVAVVGPLRVVVEAPAQAVEEREEPRPHVFEDGRVLDDVNVVLHERRLAKQGAVLLHRGKNAGLDARPCWDQVRHANGVLGVLALRVDGSNAQDKPAV